jgi:hypothetical protein
MPGMWGNTFQALDATTVYVLGSDRKLWRESGNMSNRSQVDANVLQFQALDDYSRQGRAAATARP